MPRFRLKVGEKITGPFSDAALEEMASVRVFDADAQLAPEGTEDWKAVREIPELLARFFPQKKSLSLKAKQIEVVEETNTETISVDQILLENAAAEAQVPRKKLKSLPNRRRRDFLFSVVLLNGLIWGAYFYFPPMQETQIAAASASALVTVGTYWLFYQIMDRY
ncbi:MAG: DUF4339 domain-containing protein [Nibricoccus sp.]